jgi:hypothetical protein
MSYQFAAGILGGGEIVGTLLATISKAVVALATFELGVGISKEYPAERYERSDEDVFANVRRTTTRFFGVVSIALVLEALIMVIKYSQLELAGNLYYPVAIICSASVLMISLGVFLHLTRRGIEEPKMVRRDCVPPAPIDAWEGEAMSLDRQ